MKYYETIYDNFKLRETNSKDSELILSFVKALAEYENMEDCVKATAEDINNSMFIDRRANALIAEENHIPVGFVLYYFNYSSFIGKAGLYIEDIFIKPEYRGKGYGKEIFKVLSKVAFENKCERIDWVCLNWNEPSLKFYKGIGASKMDEWIIHRLEGDKIKNILKK